MSRPPSITQEQVSATANSIQALGITPTTRNIREAVGGGNMNTILKFIHIWQSEGIQQKPPIEETLDPSISHIINNYIADQIQAARTDLVEQLAEKQVEANMLLSEYAQLSEEAIAKTAALSSLQKLHDELTGRFQQLEQEAKKVEMELHNVSQVSENVKVALSVAKLKLDTIPQHEALIAKLRDDLSKASEKATRAETRLEAELEHRKQA